MERIQAMLIPALIIALAALGWTHFSARHELSRVDSIRAEYEREIDRIRRSVREKDNLISELQAEERQLREELGIRIHDSNIFPDGSFLDDVMNQLRNRNSTGLTTDTELGRIYLNRKVLIEGLSVESFFKKGDLTIMKFPETAAIMRAEFPAGMPGYNQVAAMKHTQRYVVNFVGRISGWNGRFTFSDCRISTLWEIQHE